MAENIKINLTSLDVNDRIAASNPPGQRRPLPEATKTGRIPFTVPGTDIKAETWYSLWGDLSSSTPPMICLHGGPGVPHPYILPCSHLSSEPYSRPVIIYDQLGCGQSTHLPEKRLDTSFWTVDLFCAELDNLAAALGIKSFDLWGNSWGGMLGACYAIKQPKCLRRLIICDSPSSMKTWVEVADQLRKLLPADVQKTLTKCEEEGKTDTQEYEDAVEVFYRKFVLRVKPWPKEFLESNKQQKEDDTVYMTMNGPSEFHVTGSLKTWDITDQLHKIKVPTLLINGKYDEAQDITMEPYFREISGKVKWVRFGESSHCPFLEETDAFVEAVGRFLESDL